MQQGFSIQRGAFRTTSPKSPAIIGLPIVIAGVIVFCAVYMDLTFYRIHTLRLGVDTGTYLQTLVNFVHSGSTYNFGENRPKLSMHDSWTVIVTLAPVIALLPRVETLLISGVIIIAVAAIPLYLFARACSLSKAGSAALAGAYLLSPSAQGWAFGNFTELHFVPVLAFSLALAARRRSLVWTLICAELLTGVKEDESLFLIWFAFASMLWYDRRLGVGVMIVGIINWVGYEGLQHFFGYVPHNPSYRWNDPHALQHLAFLMEMLAPFSFLPLFLGWRILLGVPFFAELTLNVPWLGQELAHGGVHYTIPLVTVIAIGAVVAGAERPSILRYVLPCTIVMVLFFNTTVLRFGRHEYPPDWANYCAAKKAAEDGRYHVFGLEKEGEFAVAASNPNVHFVNRGSSINRPPWWSGTPPRVNSKDVADCNNPAGRAR